MVGKMERREQQRTPVPMGVPWLLFRGRKDQAFCTISQDNTIHMQSKTIPELFERTIWASYHGWLLLATKNHHTWSLWNPTTYESIRLPPLPNPKNMKIKDCIFTSSPKDRRCTVMLFDEDNATITYCELRHDRRYWASHRYQRELLVIFGKEILIYCLACLDGIIYAKAGHSHMVVIQVDNETGQLKLSSLGVDQPTSRMCKRRSFNWLLESFGELYVVYFPVEGITRMEIFGIEIYKLDFTLMVWVEVNNLDDRVMFLGLENCSSCLAAEAGLKGNRVYFCWPKDENLYTYDLEEETIFSSLACPKLRSQQYVPFWVMPDGPSPCQHTSISKEEKKKKASEVVIGSQRDDEDSPALRHSNFDILTRVASRHLKPLDYLQFRATCRFFRSAAPAPQRSITSVFSESPWLVTFRNSKSVLSFRHPKHNNTYSVGVPQSLLGTSISGSKDGYLLMVDSTHHNLCYFNPSRASTSFQQKLPPTPTKDNRLCFSSSPSSPDCLVVGTDEWLKYVDFIRPGTDQWERQELDGDYLDFLKHGPGVFHQGVFYWLGQQGNLRILKIDDGGVFRWEILEKPNAPCSGFHHSYLVECNGGDTLMAVFVGHNGNWVEVFRLDTDEMSWVRVRSLGKYTLFISNLSSIVAVATSPGMENRVYFPRFHGERIIYYSLETGKFHTDGSNIVMDNYCGTKEQLNCTWIEPRAEDDLREQPSSGQLQPTFYDRHQMRFRTILSANM